MRIWVKPDVLAKLGLGVPDLVNAVKQQSNVNPSACRRRTRAGGNGRLTQFARRDGLKLLKNSAGNRARKQ